MRGDASPPPVIEQTDTRPILRLLVGALLISLSPVFVELSSQSAAFIGPVRPEREVSSSGSFSGSARPGVVTHAP